MTNQPLDLGALIAYLINALAPYLISGAILSQGLEMLPFIKNPVENGPEWPRWAKFGLMYAVCLAGVVANTAITGHYVGLDIGTAIANTFSTATLVAGGTQIGHFGPDVITSFGDWTKGVLNVIFHRTPTIEPAA